MFNGTVGKHPTAKIDRELIPGAKPIYQQPYPASSYRKPLFDGELKNMIEDCVFRKIGESKWGSHLSSFPRKMAVSDGYLRKKQENMCHFHRRKQLFL